MKFLNFLILNCITVGLITTSCKKDDATEEITAADIIQIQDNSVAQSAFEDAVVLTNEQTTNSLKTETGPFCGCMPYTNWYAGSVVKQIEFDSTEFRGKVRSGKIIVTITYPTSGDTTDETKWTKTITFENYTVGGRKIEGTKTIVYQGKIDGVHPQWQVTLTNGKITFRSGKSITLNYTRTRIMLEGYDTPLATDDDVFQITGTGSGTNRRGIAYTSTVDLTKEAICPFFKSGTATYVTEKKTILVIYTNGEDCNAAAEIEINKSKKVIDTDSETETE